MDSIDGMFSEINGLFNGRGSVKEEECEKLSLDIVSGLTDILKKIDQKSPDNNLIDRVCEFIDEISKKEHAIWSLSKYEKRGKVLFSFLNELADRGVFLK